ncbi:hypothetical protein BUALT_Bualt02G0233200 [Buddleja alternifolia]|uniref:AIG1-type G domain-containing protein n=1 Tax=Buddleja alternifolia TaxID=168488 RepID=A0AAV6YDP8_9LAMI|nr:hypothetical protein BUALT_Bualt02G0233200 [Buddleja alternifolia]
MDSKEAIPHPMADTSSDNNEVNSMSAIKGTVYQGEGYVSGEEEFEPASDKLVVGETVDEGIGEENFIDAPENVEPLPISRVIESDGDDVEKGDKDFEGEDSGEAKFGGGVEGFHEKGEINDPMAKLGEGVVEKGSEIVDGNAGKVVVEDVEVKGEESDTKEEVGEEEGSKEVFVEPGELELVDSGDVELTTEGDSVVDTIQVDLAGPGVAVAGETEESGDAVTKAEEEEVSGVAVVEPEKMETVVGLGGEGPTPEGDSIVNPIQVDVADPQVAVVGEAEEENGVPENELKVKEFVEQENSEVGVGLGDVELTPEGGSVVDTIQVDVAAPGVVVVAESEENEEAENEPEAKGVAEVAVVEPEKSEVVDIGDVKLTPDGDSVVDTIQVDVGGPGVAVVGDAEENGGEKIEEVEGSLVSVRGDTENGDGVEKEVTSRDFVVESKPLQSEYSVVGDEKGKTLLVNGDEISKATENGITAKISTDGDEILNDGTVQTNGEHEGVHEAKDGFDPQEIREVENEMDEEVDAMSDGDDTDGMIFGGSEAAKKFIEDLERESGRDSHTGGDSSFEQSRGIDGQIVTDSEEEGDTDDEGEGKELFDSAALAALLKAATGADSDGGNITITSQDGSRLFSVERPAGLGSSLRALRPAPQPNRQNLFNPLAPAGGVESEENLSEEEKKKLEKLQQIRVKFLRLVHRLGLSPEESVAAQVLYRLALLGGRQGTQTFSLDAAKRMALELETEESDNLDFSINILVLGKSGVGKSATINSLFGEEKAPIDAFETGTASAKKISGFIDGVKVRVFDTPGLKPSVMEQGFNRSVLSSVKKLTKKSSPDVVLYVDRLDAQTRDLNDLPFLKTVTSNLGPSIWRSAIVTLTHAASAPPDGPAGAPLSYEVFVSQRSHIVQQSIGHAVGDLRMMSPSLMNPVSLVENHPSCRKNRDGQKILPNGQSWRPQLLLLCYSMKILAQASSLSKPQDPFDHRKLFGFRARSPPLPYMLSSMLQSRPHPKLASDQGGENGDSDIDLDDLSDSDQEDEDEYDQLPPFKPLKKAQLAKLSKEQKKAYFEEYDYRVKLLQKKQWREELRRMKEIKKRGKDAVGPDYGFPDEDADAGSAAPVAVPLPDMALPPSFDGDNPAYRYRFLEPTSQFLARPVLDSHGWDHDCGYDGVNLEHTLAILNRFPAAYTIQVTKDKKDFTFSLDSSISAKHGENMSTMAGFDIQSMGKQLAYIVRGETKSKNFKKHKAAGGVSFTFLGENVVPGVKIEDQIVLGKQYVLVGSAGAVKSQTDTAYGANFELQRREADYPIGQVQSTFSMSIIKWRGDLALGFNSLAQFSIGRNSKVAVRAGINNKMSGQVTVRTSSSDHLSLALAAVIPTALSIYRKLWPAAGEKYSIY